MHMVLSRRHLTRLLLVVMVLLFPVWSAGAASSSEDAGRSGQLAPSTAPAGLVQMVLRDQAATSRVAADKHDRQGTAGLVLLSVLAAVAQIASRRWWLAGPPRSRPSRRTAVWPGAAGPRAPPSLQLV